LNRPGVLIVEDNPSVRALFRLVVEREGLPVVEAGTGAAALERMAAGAIQLVITDMVLPDTDGVALAKRLRALPGAAQVPLVAISGFPPLLERAQEIPGLFAACLLKPVEPSRLVETIRKYIPQATPRSPRHPQHILVVDDNQVQLMLAKIQLSRHFARVSTAVDAETALLMARAAAPDLILSDVLMPGVDGFGLCMKIRQDLALSAIPVVLVSAHYRHAGDADFGRRVGASALIERPVHVEELVDVLTGVLSQRRAKDGHASPEAVLRLRDDHIATAQRQLQLQVALNVEQGKRSSLQAAQLSILSGMAKALTGTADVEAEVGHVLTACLGAGGIDRGALYRTDGEGAVRLSHVVGFSAEERGAVEEVFGHHALLIRTLAEAGALPIAAPPLDPAEAQAFLASAGMVSATFVPLLGGDRCVGALLVGATCRAGGARRGRVCTRVGGAHRRGARAC
jgi:CheY-like chemotaxis protein